MTPPGSGLISRRPSQSPASPPDTDRTHLLFVREQLEDPSSARDAQTSPHQAIASGTDSDESLRPIFGGAQDENDSNGDNKKESVYLDASEDNPSMTEILRELREIPDPVDPIPSPNIPPPAMLVTPQEASVPPPAARAPSRSPRKRSRGRPSFSSIASVHRPVVAPGEAETENRVEAVVELHEESAAAFQDFLCWCYPQ